MICYNRRWLSCRIGEAYSPIVVTLKPTDSNRKALHCQNFLECITTRKEKSTKFNRLLLYIDKYKYFIFNFIVIFYFLSFLSAFSRDDLINFNLILKRLISHDCIIIKNWRSSQNLQISIMPCIR